MDFRPLRRYRINRVRRIHIVGIAPFDAFFSSHLLASLPRSGYQIIATVLPVGADERWDPTTAWLPNARLLNTPGYSSPV